MSLRNFFPNCYVLPEWEEKLEEYSEPDHSKPILSVWNGLNKCFLEIFRQTRKKVIIIHLALIGLFTLLNLTGLFELLRNLMGPKRKQAAGR